jgi:hypothetical protein
MVKIISTKPLAIALTAHEHLVVQVGVFLAKRCVSAGIANQKPEEPADPQQNGAHEYRQESTKFLNPWSVFKCSRLLWMALITTSFNLTASKE